MAIQPTFEVFDKTISELINTIKYMKFGDIFNNLQEWVMEALHELFENGNPLTFSDNGTSVKAIFLLIVVMVGIIVVVLIIRGLSKQKRKQGVKAILGEEINEASSVINFREKGEICRLNGEYREATRLQFIAILFHLHQNNVLYHDHTMTGKEMIATLKKDKFVALETFSTLVKMFNYIWYGSESINQTDYNEWSKVEKNFWQEVQQ